VPIARGEGAWLYDFDGHRYLDAVSSWWVNVFGHANPRIVAALAIARIEAHYFVNRGFLAEDELVGNLHRIRHLPCTIVQGRYDVVCPPVTADALARAWPEAEYILVPDAGHSVREPGITRELLAAVRRLQHKLAAVR
jgi:proline iminopeptidase